MKVARRTRNWPIWSACAVLLVAGAARAQGNGRGGDGGGGSGSNGGNAVQSDIPAVLDVTDPFVPPSPPTVGSLSADVAGLGYDCWVGRRRTITLTLARRSPRSMRLILGPELPPDPNPLMDNPWNSPRVYFGAGIPNPSFGPDGVADTPDDHEITEVSMQIAGWENVSALGAFATDASSYSDADGNPIVVDPQDPATFSHMATTMRISFKVGQHMWRLDFGTPRHVGTGRLPTHPDTGPVVIRRWFGNGPADPNDPAVPWEVRIEPWWGNDPAVPRTGMVVGFLNYLGTGGNTTGGYAGAYDIRWSAEDWPSCWTAWAAQ